MGDYFRSVCLAALVVFAALNYAERHALMSGQGLSRICNFNPNNNNQ